MDRIALERYQRPPSLSESTLHENMHVPPHGSVEAQEMHMSDEQQAFSQQEHISRDGQAISKGTTWMKRSRKASIRFVRSVAGALGGGPQDETGGKPLAADVEPLCVEAPPERPLLLDTQPAEDQSTGQHEAPALEPLLGDEPPPGTITDSTDSEQPHTPSETDAAVRKLVRTASRLSLALPPAALFDAHATRHQLVDLLVNWEREMTALQAQIGEYRKALQLKRAATDELRGEIAGLQRAADEQAAVARRLTVQLAEAHAARLASDEARDVAVENAKTAEADRDAARAQLGIVMAEFAAASAAKTDLGAQVEALTVDMEHLRAVHTSTVSERDAARSHCDSLVRELTAAQRSVAELSERVAAFESDRAAAAEAHSAAETALETAGRRERDMANLFVAQERESERLRALLHEKELAETAAAARELETSAQAELQTAEIARLTALVAAAAKQRDDAELENARLAVRQAAALARPPTTTQASQTDAPSDPDTVDVGLLRLDQALAASEARSQSVKQAADRLVTEASSMHSQIDALDAHMRTALAHSSASTASVDGSSPPAAPTHVHQVHEVHERTVHHIPVTAAVDEESARTVAEARRVLAATGRSGPALADEDYSKLEQAVDELIERNLLIDRLRSKVIKYKQQYLKAVAVIERLRGRLRLAEAHHGELEREMERLRVSASRVEPRQVVQALPSPGSRQRTVVRREKSSGCCSSVRSVFQSSTVYLDSDEDGLSSGVPAGPPPAPILRMPPASVSSAPFAASEPPAASFPASPPGSRGPSPGPDAHPVGSPGEKKVQFHTDYTTVAPVAAPIAVMTPVPLSLSASAASTPERMATLQRHRQMISDDA